MVQGRQSHGWFGHGTGPAKPESGGADAGSAALAQRIHDLGHTLIVGLPASKRHHDAARLGAEDHARLDRVLAATVQALPTGGPAIARRVFGMPLDAPGIDGFIRAARLLRDGRDNADLRAATDALGRAAQDIGLDRFKPFLRKADANLAEQGGLLTLVRDMPGAAPPHVDAPIRPLVTPPLARPPWGLMIAGLAAQVLPSIAQLSVREDVRATITRFGLDLSKPADVTAAYAFLWAEDHGPWVFDTPQTGPAMLAMAERAMRAAQADPDLFGRAIAGDSDAQKEFSAAVAPPTPGSAIETRSDEERSLVTQMTGEGKSSAAIQAALDALRAGSRKVTAEERRNTPGVAVMSRPLARVEGPWLSRGALRENGAPLPAQVANKLVGKSFLDFRALREAIWKAVASTPGLADQFTPQNLARMENGNAPFARKIDGSSRGRVWELHHDPAIAQGGQVYDLSRITIVTPAQHAKLHNGEQ